MAWDMNRGPKRGRGGSAAAQQWTGWSGRPARRDGAGSGRLCPSAGLHFRGAESQGRRRRQHQGSGPTPCCGGLGDSPVGPLAKGSSLLRSTPFQTAGLWQVPTRFGGPVIRSDRLVWGPKFWGTEWFPLLKKDGFCPEPPGGCLPLRPTPRGTPDTGGQQGLWPG